MLNCISFCIPLFWRIAGVFLFTDAIPQQFIERQLIRIKIPNGKEHSEMLHLHALSTCISISPFEAMKLFVTKKRTHFGVLLKEAFE